MLKKPVINAYKIKAIKQFIISCMLIVSKHNGNKLSVTKKMVNIKIPQKNTVIAVYRKTKSIFASNTFSFQSGMKKVRWLFYPNNHLQ